MSRKISSFLQKILLHDEVDQLILDHDGLADLALLLSKESVLDGFELYFQNISAYEALAKQNERR